MGYRGNMDLVLAIGILLLLVSMCLFQYSILFSIVVLMISFILIKPHRLLEELLLGTRIVLPTTRGRTFFLVERRRGARREYWYGAYLELTDVHYGVPDLDIRTFIGRARTVLEGVMFDPNANYAFIVKRRGEKTRVFLQAIVKDLEKRNLKPRMQNLLTSILKHLKSHGVEARLAKVEEIDEVLKFEEVGITRRAFIIILLIGILSLIGLRTNLILHGSTTVIAPDMLLIYALVSILPSAFSRTPHYKIISPLKILLSNEAVYTIPTPYDVYNASKWVHQVFNTSGDFTLILKLRPAPQAVLDAIESKAYKLYEWGQAFDKLKTITRSKRYYTIAERRFKSKERLYIGKAVLISPERAILDQLTEIMQQLNMRFGSTLIKSYVEDIMYGYSSNPKSRDESLFYTYDLIPLSPLTIIPPKEVIGGIVLGEDEYGREVYIDFTKLPNFHGIILGSTGSGKSTLARSLILDLQEQGINSLIIDPLGEYCKLMELIGGIVLDMSTNIIDPLELHGLKPESRAESIAWACSLIFGLMPVQRDILKETIIKMYERREYFTLKEVLEELEKDYGTEVRDLVARIKTAFSLFSSPNTSISEILSELKPITLVYKSPDGTILSEEVSKFVTWMVLDQIYSYMMKEGIVHRPKIAVFIDEGHRLLRLPGEQSIIVRLYRETRKFGFSIITITQVPTDIPTILYELAGFIVVLTGPERYVRSLMSVLRIPEDVAEWLAFNSIGCGAVIRYGDPRPRCVKLRIREEALKTSR